ncbi:MAG: hypothetical protein LBE62_00140 [Azonexus sp.]|nr:hypothetical protein [Azonexus sp.]
MQTKFRGQLTYRYRQLTTGGLPRFPRFLRLREEA